MQKKWNTDDTECTDDNGFNAALRHFSVNFFLQYFSPKKYNRISFSIR
ncbi:MAG: hypothetical protein KGL19_10010 [Bacteroidota bacterium]|nr:hypothetical protein [Bacteroidota bacterium]